MKALISTRLGSTIINLTSSGLVLISNDMIIEFMQTDLPEPVVPAISMCGVLLISKETVEPLISLPSGTVNNSSCLL